MKVYRLMMRKSYEMVMFKAASLKLGLDYAVMHNMNAGSSAQEQLQQLKQDIADARGTEDEGAEADAAPGSATKPRTGKGNGRRGGRGKKEIEGISLERTENYSALSKRELENLLKHGAYDIFREEKDGTTNEESAKFHEADIDQILQRSAVVLHDEKGNSAIAKTSGIASFAKASFVSSLSASGASDNLALDDPDFWTKVVGLASKEEEHSEGNRKRKCARDVISYKEPGMSAFRAVHDSDSDDEEGGRRKKKVVRDPEEPEPVVWNEDNLQRIATSLAARGYGNWNALRGDTKLFWAAPDMSRGSRLVILQLLKWAAMSLKNTSGNEEAAGSDEKENVKATTDSVTQQVTEFDLKYLESFLRRSRACRLALAAFEQDPFQPGDIPASAVASAPSSTEQVATTMAVEGDMQPTVAEDAVLGRVLAYAAENDSNADATVEDMAVDGAAPVEGAAEVEIEPMMVHTALAKVYRAFDDQFPILAAPVPVVTPAQIDSAAATDSTAVASDITDATSSGSEQVNPVDKVVQLLLSLRLPTEFAEFETERAGKVRFAARSKLSQIEDLFELRLASELMDKYSAQSPEPATDDAQMSTDAAESVNAPSPLELFLATSSLKAWGAAEDSKLIKAVDQFGWPEGKRRVTSIVEVFIPPVQVEQIDGETAPEAAPEATVNEAEPTKEVAQSEVEAEMDTEIAESADSHTEQQTAEGLVEVTLKTYLDDSKFLVKRAKQLAQALRDFTRPKVEESNRAAERAEAAAERERAAAERAAERERKAAEKAAEKALVQAAKDAEREQRRFAQAILRSMARIGRPRSMYPALREEAQKKLQEMKASGGEHFDATGALVSWDQFTADVGLDPAVEGNIERVQAAVATLLQIGEEIISAASAPATAPAATNAPAAVAPVTEALATTSDASTPREVADESPKDESNKDEDKEGVDADGKPAAKEVKMVTSGLFAKVTHRTIESCLDKAHLLHQVRLAVVHHGIDNFFLLRATIRRSLKGAGPNTQKQKRDPTLPAWWTPHHDTALLQAVLELAAPQVDLNATASAEDEDTAEVPPEMEMTTSAAKREKEKEKEKDKEPIGINWKEVAALPSISKALPNFSLGFSNPADWVMTITPKVVEKRFQALVQAPGVLPDTTLVLPSSPDVTRKRVSAAQKVAKKPGVTPSAFGVRPAWVSSFPSAPKPVTTATIVATANATTAASTTTEPVVVDLQDEDDVVEVVKAAISTEQPSQVVSTDASSPHASQSPSQPTGPITIDATVDAPASTESKEESAKQEAKSLEEKENARNAATASPATVLDFDPTPQKAPLAPAPAAASGKKAAKEKQAPMKAGAILGFFKKAV